ncbi:zinc-binding dehydrogenase [Kibdelosporangium lantanae]
MRMVKVSRFGDPSVLVPTSGPDLEPGPGQVVIDVVAADTLFLDVVIRQGLRGGPWRVSPPYVPGAGVAGRVLRVGPGVGEEWLGRRVMAKSGTGGPRPEVETIAQAAARTTPVGGYASQAVAGAWTEIPAGRDFLEAAALVNDGLTAMLLMEAVSVRAGERVLVMPAGGGLGCLLVQLAHAAGAEVVAAARGRRKLDLASSLGASRVVDYTSDSWTRSVGRVDLAFDGVGGTLGRQGVSLARRFMAFGVPGGGFTTGGMSILDLTWTVADEARLPALALASAVSPVIGQTFPLADAPAAHAAIESRGVVGKTLLTPLG